MWSESDWVVYTEPRGHPVDHCAVYIYIVEEQLCVSAKSRVTVDSADSSGSPREVGPVRRSSRSSSGESWILARSRRSPALSK